MRTTPFSLKTGVSIHLPGGYPLATVQRNMVVMKFGGSSLVDAARIGRAAQNVAAAREHDTVVVVVSAMGGVTDLLESAARSGTSSGMQAANQIVATVMERHETALHDLCGAQATAAIVALRSIGGELTSILHGIALVGECTARSMDVVLSFGERLSALVFAAVLSQVGAAAEAVDARSLIVTDAMHGSAQVEVPESYRRIAAHVSGADLLPVITGFIAATAEGITTTLGRDGSDYTASLVAAAVDADRVEIWTDVDGVQSADPRIVPGAFVIPELEPEEAMEMAYFGAKVIHPYALLPALDRNIPIFIKNSLNPSAAGTKIARAAVSHGRMITGLASIDDVALLNVHGGGMIGVPGIAARVFTALAAAGVNIVMISQASSEHSICLCIRQREADKARAAVEAELAHELAGRRVQAIDLSTDLEIIAVIGDGMRGRPGMSGLLFGALGAHEVNVLAIAQGSSERNISFVVRAGDAKRAVCAIHDAFLGAEVAR